MPEERTDAAATRDASIRDGLTRGMDRRTFVRTVATGGYALGAAHVLGVEDFLGAGDESVQIVTALVRSDPDDPWSLEERTRTVPADWHAAVEKAFELNQWLADRTVTGYLGSAVVPGAYDSGGATISVGVVDDEGPLSGLLSDLGDGVSVDVESIVDPEPVGDDLEALTPRVIDDVLEGVPSGYACETPSSLATLGPAIHDPETGSSFFTTAEHAFDADEAPTGEQLTAPVENGDPIDLGTVEAAYPVEDVVAVSPTGDVTPSSSIDAPSATAVRGQLTRWGLADLVARDEHLEKVGALTGHTTGAIQGIDAVTCFTEEFCRRGQIRWGSEMDLTDGDSGSVSYYPDPQGEAGDALVAGFNNARTWWPGQSYVWGTAAYQLTETLGYHF